MDKKVIDYFNEEVDNLDDIDSDKFVESYTAKLKYREKENVEDLNYIEDEVRTFYIYPLYSLRGKTVTDGLRIAKDKITIMATMPENVIKTEGYLTEAQFDYDLTETVDPVNPTEQLMRLSDTISFKTTQIKEIDTNYLYLLTKEAITENNFDNLKQYIGKALIQDFDEEGIQMVFSSLEEFSSSFRTSPIRIVLSPPITNKIKQIQVTSPKGSLIGNIKVVDDEGRFPNLIASEGTEIYPKLCFPFQTEPVLSLVDYWSSEQIVPLKDIFSFLDSKGLKYNQEFSLNDFLKLGSDSAYPTMRVDHVQEISWTEEGEQNNLRFNQGNDVDWGYIELAETTSTYKVTKKITLNESYDLGTVKYEWMKNSVREAKLWAKPKAIENLNIVVKEASKNSSAFEIVAKMLTESFWKDYEFKGATEITYSNGDQIEKIRDKEIYELSQKYSGQDRYTVNTNLWLSWKKINQDKVNSNIGMIKRIENTLTMLSGYIKSNFSINKGDNDDYKILLPYFFELQNPIDNPINFVHYTDIRVKLKSNYFEFTEKEFKPKEKSISKNKIHKLEYNHYAFPEMRNSVETASIPSSMPLDQQTANGEYSKYQVKIFSNIEKDLFILQNDYGNGQIEFNPLGNQKISNNGQFDFENKANININEIKISSFFGAGIWRIVLIDINNTNTKMDLNLFDKSDSTNSFINLIL